MTIYYVDPVNGSNSNNGTAWGTAWKWLPGNGTALAAGDEVRFAKSPERTSGSVPVGTNYVTASSLGTVAVSIGTSAVASLAGVTVTGSRLNIPANTSVPANTQIGRWAFSRSQTTLNGVGLLLVLKGIPTSQIGGNLKVCLCSDAAGTTIIATLNGPTSVTTNTTETSLCQFLFNSASTLNLSIASIAVYSISAFTTENFAGSIDRDSNIHFTPLQTGTSFFKPSAAARPNSPPATARAMAYTAPHIAMVTGVAGGLGIHQPITSTSSTISQTVTQYDPLPTALMPLIEASLNFSGNSGSRIRLRGGFNTATNTQDGYTNVALDSITWAPRKGAFVFSGGGQYVDFENFICLTSHLAYYDYAVATLNSFRLYSCIVGTTQIISPTSEPGALATSEANSTLTVTEFYAEKCRLKTVAPVRRWKACAYSATEAYGFASGNLTFGTISLVDCSTSLTSYAAANAASSLLVTSQFNVTSSVAGTTRSLLDSGITSGTFQFHANTTAPVLFKDTAFVNGGDVQGQTSAGATLAVTFQDVTITDTGSNSTITSYFRSNNVKTTTINGVVLHASTTTATHYLAVVSSATFYTNNPTGHSVTVGGAVGTSDGENTSHPFSGIYLIYVTPATTLTFNSVTLVSSYRRPGLAISSLQSGEVVVDGWDGSFIAVDTPNYVTGSYYPSVPRVKIVNSNGVVAAGTMPTGSVKRFGGSAAPSTEYKVWSSTFGVSSSAFSAPSAQYKVTVPADITDSLRGITSPTAHRRIVAEDISITSATFTGVSSAFSMGMADIHLAPDATFDLTGLPTTTSSYGFYRGVFARKPNGEFVFKSNYTVAYTEAVNVYGKRSIVMRGAFRLASLDVLAGTTVTLNVRVRASAVGKFFLLTVAPAKAHAGGLDTHAFRKNLLTSTEDVLMSVSFSPTQDGTVAINAFCPNAITIKDFTTSVA